MPSLSTLYYAYRQAKTALFFERRGVGLLKLGEYEHNLEANLCLMQRRLATNGGWFDGIDGGEVWITPKRLRMPAPSTDQDIRIGIGSAVHDMAELDVQIRLSPSPDFAIAEVLYLWAFGPALESLLSPNVVGYRLDAKNGKLSRTRRWLFEYWPPKYQKFRTAPLDAAHHALESGARSVVLTSADLASFYDSVDASFLISAPFLERLHRAAEADGVLFDAEEYGLATASLLSAYAIFRQKAHRRTGVPWNVGIPIGALTSRVVANVALEPLDRWIEQRPENICYQRYVDDLVVVSSQPDLDGGGFLERLSGVLPLSEATGDQLHLDCALLERSGCEFQVQKGKVRIHTLGGVPGRAFLNAVGDDFQRLVSEHRAFLDADMIVEDAVAHLTRSGKSDGSPLRVLRDADRVHLEHFALSTSLRSLERISVLVDPAEARKLARITQEQIGRVLDDQGDWVDNLDLSLRLLRLAVATDDCDSALTIHQRMNGVWQSVESLRASVARLWHRGREIPRDSAWVWLRNYLHERRVEMIMSVLRPEQQECLDMMLEEGIPLQTRMIGRRKMLRGARLLAAADLRSRDREDDEFGPNPLGMCEGAWLQDALAENPALARRFAAIQEFSTLCGDLDGRSWAIPPARLFLCTRPPSYFDIARRWLYKIEESDLEPDVFERLLEVVNAIRGTAYSEPVGHVAGNSTIEIVDPQVNLSVGGVAVLPQDPRVVLGNLVVDDAWWAGAATRVPGSRTGRPLLSLRRLRGLATVVETAVTASRRRTPSESAPPTLLVLPELSLPRRWFRTLANHLVRRTRVGLVVGLEYLHHRDHPFVYNQVVAVLPGPLQSAATWPWTKRLPARNEAFELSRRPTPVSFRSRPPDRKRTVVRSRYGDFSVLICSELIETRRVADLLGRVDLVLSPSWNTDTASYDHLIQSVGLQLHAIIAVANNGHYSDCRVWGPRTTRWLRDFCRLVSRDVDAVISVDLPLAELRRFREFPANHVDDEGRSHPRDGSDWRPLPPDW